MSWCFTGLILGVWPSLAFLGGQLSTPYSYFLSCLQSSQSIFWVSSPFCRLGSFSLLQVRERLEWLEQNRIPFSQLGKFSDLPAGEMSFWKADFRQKNLGEFHNGYSLPVRATEEIFSDLQIRLERTCWHFWREVSPATHDCGLALILVHTQPLAIHQNY